MKKEKPVTKQCKYCKMEIPHEAKICPHCRKKQSRGCLVGIIVFIVIILLISCFAGGNKDDKPQKANDNSSDNNTMANNSDEQTTEEIKTTEEENKETVFRKGEIAELNGVQVTLTDYTESNGSDYNKPTDGNIFLLVEFEIVNNTEKDLAISSMLSFESYADDYALNYSLSALMENDGKQLDGSIASGKKMKGWIGWEVPQDYQNVEIYFKDNVWSNNKFVFSIEK